VEPKFKHTSGPDAKPIDWENVKKMGAIGSSSKDVAYVLGFRSVEHVSDRCLKETGLRLHELLKQGLAHNKVNLRTKMWDKAVGFRDDTKMQIHLAQVYLEEHKENSLSVDSTDKKLIINFGGKPKAPDPEGEKV
jgi:hypothetical protein